ncbi:hypothetical protein R1sor_002688 [Riccia sorocarpa]|uniref:WASH complex subunit 7 n=1 Tax=Riccia sorocarpa TaxID=122646 RepID=A0ABD3H158_9MARC
MTTSEEEQEKLRRFVDEWRSHIWDKLEQCDSNSTQAAARDVGDISGDPIHILTKPLEGLTILDLIATDNIILNKLLIVLAHDCHEIQLLRKQALKKIYPRLVVFGLPSSHEETPLEGELQKSFAKSFRFFQDLLEFVAKLRAVLFNLVQQLEAIYTGDGSKGSKRPYASFSSVHLRTAVQCLADGFTVLITIDEIVAQNSAIGHSLSLFTRMLHTVRSEPSSFRMEPDQVETLHFEVSKVDSILMGGLFQRCLQEDFYGNMDMQKLKSNRQCLDEIIFCVREGLLQIFYRLDSLREYPYDREKIIGLMAVWVCHSWMTGETPEKKVTKLAMDLQRRSPVLYLFSNVRFILLEFLVLHLPSWALASPIIKEARKDSAVVNANFLASLDDGLSSHSQSLRSGLANWFVSFDSTVSPAVQQLAIHAMLGTRFKQLTQGVCLANRLRHILRATIDVHAYLEVPVNKEQLKRLRQVAEILKAIEAMFHRRSFETALGLSLMLQLAQSQILRRLTPLKMQLEAELTAMSRSSGVLVLARTFTRGGKDMDTKIMDALAAVNLAIKMAQSCSSVQSNITLRLALDVCTSLSKVPEEVAAEMMDLCSVIELVADIHSVVKLVTDCSFLYWNRDTMPACFRMLYRKTGEARHLQLVVSAFGDAVNLMKAGNADRTVIESYENEVEEALSAELLAPLCRDIETDLRLHVHSAHLKGAVNVNPTKTGVRDLSWFLHLKPLRLTSKRIHIKSRVESYLNAAFYNHAAVALHNWKTYGEMRYLAELKYGLELDDIHLPGQTLEQGVDVLEIMRNIHLFVACYTYNLNTQVFIERVSNARNRKYLNTVNVRHVANSIRTHGTGIMSTTVNFAYQFLAQKFVVFSQFLFDDHIKSLLIKEHRFFKDHRERGGKDYPVIRAEKLNKDIRKLGLTDDGLSFLDQFRRLIAEMGNALGFVRMVRLGGLHYCSSASGFVHNLDMDTTFREASREAGIPAGGVYAGKILDEALESQKMSLEGMDYLNILTNVFAPELRSNDNLHLRTFFLIVPTLIVNAIEAILQDKEKLSKRGRDAANGMFTDDGFALGLAYILKVLGQNTEFDSLHWFDSARNHYQAEKARIEDGLDMDGTGSGMNGLQIWSQKLASISEEEAHNMQLVMKRFSNYMVELELIFYTFSGARIFFQ